MSLIDPRTGRLYDFIPRPGDAAPPGGVTSLRQRWGARELLSTFTRTADVFVDTGDLDHVRAIDLQMRFALNGTGNVPVSPFTFSMPALANTQLAVTVNRSVDPDAAPTGDVYLMPIGGIGSGGETLPVDVIVSRRLTVRVDFIPSPGTTGTPVWVEMMATPVENIGTRNRVVGWPEVNAGVPASGFVAAVASPANVQLLAARASRAQFIIVNTSTNADMIVRFGPGASWVGPTGTLVLPANTFSEYESPIGGYRGAVTASWNNAAPDGGALITEGNYFSPGQ